MYVCQNVHICTCSEIIGHTPGRSGKKCCFDEMSEFVCVCPKAFFFSDSLCCLWDNSHTHTHAHSHTRRHTHKHIHTQTHTSDHPLLLYLKWLTLIWTVTPFSDVSLCMLTFTVVQAWVQSSDLNQRERTFSICKNSYSGWIIPVLPLFF